MNVTANGIRMHYALEGPAGAPVVTLSHSLAARLEMWEPQVKALAGRWRVLRYDTRGHGGSDAPAGPYTLDELAEDARALLGALGISTTHWVGLSMGGMIGQTLALEAPELFASLVLCDTTSRVPPERSEEHTSELQSQSNLVCRLLLEKKNRHKTNASRTQVITTQSATNPMLLLTTHIAHMLNN